MFSSTPQDHRRAAVAGVAFCIALALLVHADQPSLAASDLSVPGPTLDTRPLDGRKAASAKDDDALPQENALASNETPDISVPGSNAEAAADTSPAGPVPASIVAAANAGADTSASLASSTPAPAAVTVSTNVNVASDSITASATDPNAGTQIAAANGPAPLTGASPTVAAVPPPSSNATVNLINLMVKRNLISQDDAEGLIREAQQEADTARAQQATTQAAAQRALVIQQSQPAPAPTKPASSDDDEMRISYVPDIVKKQITDQVTQNVMEETREEHIAGTIADSEVPEWIRRIHLTGDIRLRFEDDILPSGNALGNFVNYNAINTGSAYNVSKSAANPTTPPQFDVDQNRDRFRLRLRIGAGIDLGSNFTAGVRIATGSDDNPTTENQTLGAASGQGGNFSKYQVWLDRAFLRYEYGGTPQEDASVTIGRFDNPFYSTSMVWANDLAFDGIVAKGSYEVTPGVTPFLTVGAFPIFNTDFNFSTNNAAKFKSEDKYLFAVQGGAKWQINKDISVTGAAAFYDFENIEGKVSDPIDSQDSSGDVTGSTDDSRPSFAQNGNTYVALRNYTGATAAGANLQQYFGLASRFQVVSVYGKLDYSHFDPIHLSVTGEFIDNVAFDRNEILNGGPASDPGPQNNTTSVDPNSFDGGHLGYMVHFDAGKVALEELWDWNIRLSYRYVQTDATVDAFTDSDFGAPLYGTNLKGFTLGGTLALSKRVWLGLSYFSADNVSGPTFHSDVVQFDVNAKF